MLRRRLGLSRGDDGLAVCPVCGDPHCFSCGSDTVTLLPQRDAMAAAGGVPDPPAPLPSSESEPFTTATYDRAKHGRKKLR